MFEVDEALNSAYAALNNTNNPDDQVKIKNLYKLFKEGKIKKSEFDKSINYYIKTNYTAGHLINRDELRDAAIRYENVKPVLNGRMRLPANDTYEIGKPVLNGRMRLPDIKYSGVSALAPAPEPVEPIPQQPAVGKADSTAKANVAKQGVDIGVQHNAENGTENGVSLQDAVAKNMQEHPEIVGKLAGIARNITDAVMQAAKAQGKTDAAKQGETPTTDGAHTEKVATNPGNGIDVQGKSEIPNSSAVSDANAAKDQQPQKADVDVKAAAGKINKPGEKPSMSDDKIDALWDVLSGNTAGGTQGVQGAQAGNAVARGGVQGSNNRSGKKPRMSDAEINAFLKEELGIDTTDNGAYASAGVAKGGTKTIGYDPYDPNPGNVSLAYAMRNAPEQERKAALINEWNKEHGISYVTGKDGVIYRIDPQHPNGYVDPFKNDLSTWIRATGYASPGISKGGTYATGEGIETPMPANASGNFKIAWKDPMSLIALFGRGAFTDDEYNQLVNHAVNDLGFNEELFSGSRYK